MREWTLVSNTKSKNQGGKGTSIPTSSGSARDTKKLPSGSSAHNTSIKKLIALSRKSTFLLAHME